MDIEHVMTVESARVRCVDVHPTAPWFLCGLDVGDVNVWNYETNSAVQCFQVCERLPVHAAKFVARKNWLITASGDLRVRVFDLDTQEVERAFEASDVRVRCIAVHPVRPYVLTAGSGIKLWNWDRDWECQRAFEGHSDCVMQIVFDPMDDDAFASAGRDAKIKVWHLDSSTCECDLKGHAEAVNCLDYYHDGDKPCLVSGSDDWCVKIWDYQNGNCVQTLKGHTKSVSAVSFHPELQILLTGSWDGSVKIWHARTYRLQTTLRYDLDRVWTVFSVRGSNDVAIGYDEGTIIIKVGPGEPAISMNGLCGTIICAKGAQVQRISVDSPPIMWLLNEIKDGKPMCLLAEDVGYCETYPQTIAHSPNGRFVAACGGGEYIIYTSPCGMWLVNVAFGTAQGFAWAFDSSKYATLDEFSTIKVFKDFKETKSIKPKYSARGIFGGYLLGVELKSVSHCTCTFYDWENLELIAIIEIQPRHVYWSESGTLVCITTDHEGYWVFRYNAARVARAKELNVNSTKYGIEKAFETVFQMPDVVKSGLWVRDCFIYTNSSNELNYYVGGEIVTISDLDRTMYILGYVARHSRLYLTDNNLNIISYSLLLSVLTFQMAVMSRHYDVANRMLPLIPVEHYTSVAHFLQKQGYHHEAFAVTTDLEHRFELALSIGELQHAKALMERRAAAEGPSSSLSYQWSRLGVAAAEAADEELMEVCYQRAKDYNALLRFARSTGDKNLLKDVAEMSAEDSKENISFGASFMLNDFDACLQVLIKRNKLPEAALFARSYVPAKLAEVVKLWRESITTINKETGQSLADSEQHHNLILEFAQSLQLEGFQCEIDPSVSTDATSLPINLNLSDSAGSLIPEKAESVQTAEHSPNDLSSDVLPGSTALESQTSTTQASPVSDER